MTEQLMMEQMSKAFAKAVAAHAGLIMREYTIDYGIDGRFSDVRYDQKRNRYSENGFGIDFQIKATTNLIINSGRIVYDLEVKNYLDLIETDIGTPRILIVYSMPKEREQWITVTENETVLKKCAWWCTLKGHEDTDNKSKIRIEIPEKQLLTTNELQRLIQCVREGAEL